MVEFVAAGGIFIDDIVYPDGKTDMEILGGGGTHAAVGMLVWEYTPGLISYAGKDIPEKALNRVQRDFDTQGVIMVDLPQVRAWQIFEWNGRRTEVYRVDDVQSFIVNPRVDQVPDAYHDARGICVLRDAKEIRKWRERYPEKILLWEPLQQIMHRDYHDTFITGLPYADIVSPNLLEASLIYAMDDPEALVHKMLDGGAKIAALRMGEEGSLIGAQESENLFHIPAVPVPEMIDQTGAGNTYCGAFLVGYIESGGDLVTAGCYGAVAASFCLETVGVAELPSDFVRIRDARYRDLRERLEQG